MPADLWGNAVSEGSRAALAAIDAFAGGLVAYEARAATILAAAEADATHPLVATWAGVLTLLGEHEAAVQAARPWLAAAEAGLDRANPRERRHFVALRAWIDGAIDEAILELETLVAEYPRDLTALKLLHYHLFNRGDFPGLLRTAELAVAAAPELAYVHGMAAFGYEQLHLLDEAEAAARRALSIEPREPWAQHALAHVMLTEGRIDEGIGFLETARPGWTRLNSFMLTHLWWHLALFYLSAGREADALAAYDDQVWAVAKDYSQDQIGAVSLLARLEMGGVAVGARWQDLGTHLAARKTDVVQPFLSVQYLYGLARAGREEADALLDAIAAAAADKERQDRLVWQQVALPLAQGLVAHARGGFAAAAEQLADVLPRLIRLGGSHAQRDLFEIVLLDARIRSGDFVEAQQMLALRRAHDPDGVPLNRSLAAVYRALGLPALADAADARVRARLP
ncbi:tetratricopeptide repeat protein [Flavisphingomonas formosensis]|uniref:tetratricopeptide repeat protein n=1 Tax=Flavisphingomonas formosensis TaxID=861534 RepID=UPI0012F8B570|nr:tetratricopeptide repeat protein [Sphingomonas formosensis]